MEVTGIKPNISIPIFRVRSVIFFKCTILCITVGEVFTKIVYTDIKQPI